MEVAGAESADMVGITKVHLFGVEAKVGDGVGSP